MRFLLIVKAATSTANSIRADQLLIQMARFHEELARAGALLDGAGLMPSEAGWRIRYGCDNPGLIDGLSETSATAMAGYTVIQARSRDEALEWSKRFPSPRGEGFLAEIEVRPLRGFDEVRSCPILSRLHPLDLGR
ncbi:MAG: YciI family protein [Burkholderiales bacterium]|nr:YciI family protein [Burkholderiales bacterium]